MRTLAIGDIHGCHKALVALLGQIDLQHDDRVIFLGDYIDRGPASRQVIETMLTLKESCSPVFLRGNHEVMILSSRLDSTKGNLWQSYGGFEMLASYGAGYQKRWVAAIPAAHWRFFEDTIPFFETDTNIFVHACLDPEVDMKDQSDWLLYWEYFDRIRPHKSGKKIICGHSPQRSGEINDVGFAACIDTAAVRGGWLTCLDVDSRNYWQANEKGISREGRLSKAAS